MGSQWKDFYFLEVWITNDFYAATINWSVIFELFKPSIINFSKEDSED